MARLLSDWINSYLEYTKNTEPPLSFHIWCALSCISGALQRRCYFSWGHSHIFPNQYIVLVGPSGQSRKGEAINLILPFFDHLNIPRIPESIIREALIRRLKDSITQFTNDKGEIRFQCAVTIISEELTVFLGQKDTKFLGDLTNWYDSREEWTYDTKHQGTDRIVGLCVNLLAATAPDWISSMLSHEAIGGGWTSRVVFVVEDWKRQTIADPNVYTVDTKLRKDLEHDLEEIFDLRGQFRFDAEALQMYTDWYVKQDKDTRAGKLVIPDPKFAGYVSRRQTHIKKICMALSASRGNSLIITGADFERALKILETTEKKMPRAFAGVGRARFSEMTETVLNYIMMRRKCLKSELLRRLYRDIDSWSLEQIEKVLSDMHVLKVTIMTDKDDTMYEFIGGDATDAPEQGDEEQSQTPDSSSG